MKKIISKWTFGWFLLLASVLSVGVPVNSYAKGTVERIDVTALQSLLEVNKGKVIIVDLWATWCPPCRKEIPGFINLYRKYRDQGMEIIGVAFDRKGSEVVSPFIEEKGINYPVYLSGDGIASAYDLRAYPTTIIYNKEGNIDSIHVGYRPESFFDSEINKLLGD